MIEFVQELPTNERRAGRESSRAVLNLLMERPGEWGRIRQYPKGSRAGYVYASQCRNGRNQALSPDKGVEVVAMLDPDGKHVSVWARYLPPMQDA